MSHKPKKRPYRPLLVIPDGWNGNTGVDLPMVEPNPLDWDRSDTPKEDTHA